MAESDFFIRPVEPARPLRFDGSKCVACNRCVEVCPIDLLTPAQPGGVPRAAYPEECWYCGCCVMECPTGAVSLEHPLMNRVRWISKTALEKNR
jgi:NAD-dependent dihydropyrimidine dehydrogenase PreA subunit